MRTAVLSFAVLLSLLVGRTLVAEANATSQGPGMVAQNDTPTLLEAFPQVIFEVVIL